MDPIQEGERYKLICGECRAVLRGLPAQSIDLLVTSPPYCNAREYSVFSTYDRYLYFLDDFLTEAVRIVKPNRIVAVNVSCVIEKRQSRGHESTRLPIPFDLVGLARAKGLKFLDDIIWQKPDGASGRAIKFAHLRRPVAYKPFQVTEYILIFKNGAGLLDGVIRAHSEQVIQCSLVRDGYERTNVWKINPERVNGHPAPFPLDLASRLVAYYSFVGDLVIDPFMGSATTGVAALRTGRRFLGIERDPVYFERARDRIEKEQ